jgi:transcription elongation factor
MGRRTVLKCMTWGGAGVLAGACRAPSKLSIRRSPGYVPDQTHSPASRELWQWNTPGRHVVGDDCDMPSSTCSNDDRIND